MSAMKKTKPAAGGQQPAQKKARAPRRGQQVQGKTKTTGREHREQKKQWIDEMELRTHRPEELLDPAALLARFTERAAGLLEALPADTRPTTAVVTAALRQAVLEAFRTREEYVARLVESDAHCWGILPAAKDMRRGIRTSLVDSGIRVVESPEEEELFVVVEGEGEGFEVVRPAYVDQSTGKLVLSGQLRRIPLRVGRRIDDEGRDGAGQGATEA
ncbi:hypothetical protein V2W30_33335 [Streptomyces sp. Q6]|uniref:Uncharacterized protein n=1 Tax=Streptomyces citrinus TaxID=3118173 RepID=A0ACD5AL17_9ACTN